MMYACGHDERGERNLEYENLLPHQRMSMSNGQCPKCVQLRNKRQSFHFDEGAGIKIGNFSSPQIIGPDPEILAIMRLFLEKYEILADEDRKAYRNVIAVIMNPPLAFYREGADER